MEKYNVFFISDTHFHHVNSLYFKPKRRTLAGISLEELQNGDKEACARRHDEWLISVWNGQVKKNDIVYILGDFCLGNKETTENILMQLNGRKCLILGNHDKSCKGLENYFEWVGQIKEAKFTHEMFPFIKEEETFCVEMCHFPLLAWNRKSHGTVHACGHIHGAHDFLNDQTGVLRVDVGLDAELSNYSLIPLEKLYGHFREIVESHGFKTFQEYAEFLYEKQGFRD